MFNDNNENNSLNINEETSPAVEETSEDTATEAVEERAEAAEDTAEETCGCRKKKEKVKKEHKPISKKAKFRLSFSAYTVLFIVVVIALNLLLGAISTRVNLNIDLTSDKLLSLSDETVDVLKNLDKEVNIYSIVPSVENEILEKIELMLKRYPQYSNKITFEKIDTIADPDFLTPYAADGQLSTEYSVIFDCNGKYKIVDLNGVLDIDSSNNSIKGITAEQEFTGAIVNVTSDTSAKIGVVGGHEELIEYDVFNQQLLMPENYEGVAVDLYSGEVPADIDLIIIPSPTKDFDPVEITNLDSYLDRGGRVQLIYEADPLKTPNLTAYLKEWGVEMPARGYVYETSPQRYIQYPTNILVDVVESEITRDFADEETRFIYPAAKALKVNEVYGVESQPLISSFPSSFAKYDPAASLDKKQPEDIDGPLNLAVILSKGGSNPNRFMIMGGTGFISVIGTNAYANEDFYFNTLAYLTDSEGSIYIRPKDISPAQLAIPALSAVLISIFVVIIIPLAILIAGFVVWNKRRHL